MVLILILILYSKIKFISYATSESMLHRSNNVIKNRVQFAVLLDNLIFNHNMLQTADESDN